jgi:plasmid stabilization system protein ParE
MLQLLRVRLKQIAKQPQPYRLRPELAPDARMAIVGNYVILFRIRDNTVRIERIVQGNRDLPPMIGEPEN